MLRSGVLCVMDETPADTETLLSLALPRGRYWSYSPAALLAVQYGLSFYSGLETSSCRHDVDRDGLQDRVRTTQTARQVCKWASVHPLAKHNRLGETARNLGNSKAHRAFRDPSRSFQIVIIMFVIRINSP